MNYRQLFYFWLREKTVVWPFYIWDWLYDRGHWRIFGGTGKSCECDAMADLPREYGCPVHEAKF